MNWLTKISTRSPSNAAPTGDVANEARPLHGGAATLEPKGKPPGRLASLRKAVTGAAKRLANPGATRSRATAAHDTQAQPLSQRNAHTNTERLPPKTIEILLIREIKQRGKSWENAHEGLGTSPQTGNAWKSLVEKLAVDQVRSDTAQGKRLELNNATSGGYLAAGMDAAAALLEHCERRGMTDDQTTRVLQLRERGMSDTDALARVAQESELTALLGSPNPMHGAGLVHPEASEQNSSLAALNSDTA